MPNLSALSNITTKATALSNLVLVSPQSVVGYQPQNPNNDDGTFSIAAQPPSFLFQYEGDQSATFESDITDHYVEINLPIQDQIALKPEIYTTRGFIGELNDVTPAFLKPVKFAADKLTNVTGLAPQLTTTALIAYNEAFFLYQVGRNAINSAVAAWSSIANLVTGSGGQSVIGADGITIANSQNKQQTAFQQLYGYWRERRLFTVQTPWAVFQNMAILRLKAIQDEETSAMTDFELTFKMIRTARTLSQFTGRQISDNSLLGRSAAQGAQGVDLGTSSPPSNISLQTGLSNMGVA